jgi:hypothetical protein
MEPARSAPAGMPDTEPARLPPTGPRLDFRPSPAMFLTMNADVRSTLTRMELFTMSPELAPLDFRVRPVYNPAIVPMPLA